MSQELQLQVKPKVAATEALLKREVAFKLKVGFDEIRHIEILKRSIDARQKAVKINLKVAVYIHEDFERKLLHEHPRLPRRSQTKKKY